MTQGALPTSGATQGAPIPCVLNRGAGTARTVLETMERDPRFIVRVCDPVDICDAVVDAMAERPGRIAMVGGDGTVATAAGALVRSGVELAVIPAGTLNHLARSLAIPTKVEDALHEELFHRRLHDRSAGASNVRRAGR